MHQRHAEIVSVQRWLWKTEHFYIICHFFKFVFAFFPNKWKNTESLRNHLFGCHCLVLALCHDICHQADRAAGRNLSAEQGHRGDDDAPLWESMMKYHVYIYCLYMYVLNLYLCLSFPMRETRDKTSSKISWDILRALFARWHARERKIERTPSFRQADSLWLWRQSHVPVSHVHLLNEQPQLFVIVSCCCAIVYIFITVKTNYQTKTTTTTESSVFQLF